MDDNKITFIANILQAIVKVLVGFYFIVFVSIPNIIEAIGTYKDTSAIIVAVLFYTGVFCTALFLLVSGIINLCSSINIKYNIKNIDIEKFKNSLMSIGNIAFKIPIIIFLIFWFGITIYATFLLINKSQFNLLLYLVPFYIIGIITIIYYLKIK